MSCNICPICATPIVSNIACNINFSISYLIFATLLYSAYVSHVMHFSFVMFLNDACLHLGDAFTWATPSFLAAPSPRRRLLSWRHLDLGDTFFLGDASHYFKRRKIKAENQGSSFSQTGFTFYLGDLIKKPPRGKKSVPFNYNVT